MERVRKSKTKPTLESVVFVTPEQKLLRFLLGNSTTAFSPRKLSSKLKGVRGLGGSDGIIKILKQLEEIGLVHFVNNKQEIKLNNDHVAIKALKTFSAICDLESIQSQVEPCSKKGVLFGSRAHGEDRSDSDYDLFVVSDDPDEVQRRVTQHPLGKRIELTIQKMDEYLQIENKDPGLATELNQGVVMWGANW